MEVKRHLLDSIKCEYCLCYVSYGPIWLKSNGSSVCGRCNIRYEDKKSALLNKPLETFISEYSFPCRYRIYGCFTKCKSIDMKEHETKCKFAPVHCPVTAYDTECDWKGKLEDIEQHYKYKHEDLIVNHPYETKQTLKSSTQNANRVMQVFGFLFLLQFKSSISQRKFWYSIRLLDDKNLVQLFDYCLEVKNSKGKIIKENIVHPFANYLIQAKDSIETNVNTVMAVLGDCKTVEVKLRVTMKEIDCYNCKKRLTFAPIHFNKGNGYTCASCTKELQKTSLSDFMSNKGRFKSRTWNLSGNNFGSNFWNGMNTTK